MRTSLTLLLIAALSSADAGVFRHIGPDGEVYFSDQPGRNAEPVDIGPTQTIRMPQARPRVPAEAAATANDDAEQDVGPAYAQFSIIKPSHDQGVRANDGSVTVYLELQPALQPGHAIVLTVDGEDGEMIHSGDMLNFNLVDMSRGRHTVAAKVVDEQGNKLIETGPVGFYVLRVALGQRVTTQ